MELFTQFPDLANAWIELDEDKAWRKFKPSQVRQKLGDRSQDLAYSFLSEHGTHPTWRMIRDRAVMRAEPSPEGSRETILWIGGTRLVHSRVLSVLSCLQALVLTIFKLAATFAQ